MRSTSRPARVLRIGLVAAVVVAVALMLVPAQVKYADPIDFELRTGSCGVPVANVLGAEPNLRGQSSASPGPSATELRCEVASGRRVIAALVVLLGASVVWGMSRRRQAATETTVTDPSL